MNSRIASKLVLGMLVSNLLIAVTAATFAPADVGSIPLNGDHLVAIGSIGAGCIAFTAAIGYVVVRMIVAPIARMEAAAGRLAAGDYSTQIHSGSEDELGALAQGFDGLAAALKQREQIRRHFVGELSRELRAPLAALARELEALSNRGRTLTRESFRSMQAEVAALNILVSDFYDLSLAEVGALSYRMQDVDMTEILGAVCEGFRERFEARGIELDTRPPGHVLNVHGDPRRLRQLLNNLLEYAAHWARRGGTISLALRPRDDFVELDLLGTVPADSPAVPTAASIPPSGTDSTHGEVGGNSLALSLCQRIVQAHGGSIVAAASGRNGLGIEIVLRRGR